MAFDAVVDAVHSMLAILRNTWRDRAKHRITDAYDAQVSRS